MYNPLLQCFHEFSYYHPVEQDATMELLDPGTSNEIAAQHEAHNIFVHRKSKLIPAQVSILHTLYEPLQYPILFPHGVGGWGDTYQQPQNGHWTQIVTECSRARSVKVRQYSHCMSLSRIVKRSVRKVMEELHLANFSSCGRVYRVKTKVCLVVNVY